MGLWSSAAEDSGGWQRKSRGGANAQKMIIKLSLVNKVEFSREQKSDFYQGNFWGQGILSVFNVYLSEFEATREEILYFLTIPVVPPLIHSGIRHGSYAELEKNQNAA